MEVLKWLADFQRVNNNWRLTTQGSSLAGTCHKISLKVYSVKHACVISRLLHLQQGFSCATSIGAGVSFVKELQYVSVQLCGVLRLSCPTPHTINSSNFRHCISFWWGGPEGSGLPEALKPSDTQTESPKA